jgi:hypothetical protein
MENILYTDFGAEFGRGHSHKQRGAYGAQTTSLVAIALALVLQLCASATGGTDPVVAFTHLFKKAGEVARASGVRYGRDSGDAFDVDVYRLPTEAIHVDVNYAPLIGETATDEHSFIELRAMCAVVAAYDKIEGAEHAREKRIFGRLASDVCRVLLMQTHAATGDAGSNIDPAVVAAHWYLRSGEGSSARQLYNLATDSEEDPVKVRTASRLVADAEAIVETIFAG